MAVAPIDVKSWIVQRTESKSIGKEAGSSTITPKNKGNCEFKVGSPVSILAGGRVYDLARGTVVVVYEKPKKSATGKFNSKSKAAMATIFIENESDKMCRQLTVYMNDTTIVKVRRSQ